MRTGKGCTVTKKDTGQRNCKDSKVQKRKSEPEKLKRRGRRDHTRKLRNKNRNTHEATNAEERQRCRTNRKRTRKEGA